MVSGGMTCVKYLLFCFNLLFALSGISLITIGTIIHTIYYHYSEFVYRNVQSVPALIVIIGIIVFITAFFGCCGAVKENHCMIMTFSLLVFIIITTEIAAAITSYLRREEMKDMLTERVNITMQEYPKYPGTQKSWDIMQHELQCCGMYGPSDWTEIFHNNTLPHTCCPNTMNDGSCTIDTDDKYETSCLKTLEEVFVKYASLIIVISASIGFSQLIGVVCACCLARSIRKEYETV